MSNDAQNIRPILLIDAMNLFARHYIRNPAMSSHGHHAGGVVGFLSSLRMLVEMIHPSTVFVVWEGGGSPRRRAIFPDYKKDRKPPRLNRYYEDDIPDSSENRIQQVKSLIGLLNHLPVCQIFVDDCEADDVIGYVCRNKFKDRNRIIASSDKDYYQLIDERTKMYSWTSKKFVDPAGVLAEYGISSSNFAVAKAIVGDPSDGIPGIKGVGFKTLAKRFPRLASDEECSTADIIVDSENLRSGGLKMIQRICEGTEVINRNWRLMYLDVSNLAAMQIRKVDSVIGSFKPTKNKLQLMRGLIDEGLPTVDVHDLFSAFVAL